MLVGAGRQEMSVFVMFRMLKQVLTRLWEGQRVYPDRMCPFLNVINEIFHKWILFSCRE